MQCRGNAGNSWDLGGRLRTYRPRVPIPLGLTWLHFNYLTELEKPVPCNSDEESYRFKSVLTGAGVLAADVTTSARGDYGRYAIRQQLTTDDLPGAFWLLDRAYERRPA